MLRTGRGFGGMSVGTSNRVVAIAGRPNVGKSAIFNRLLGRRVAIVHSESGVTRDRLIRSCEWEGQQFSLVDTGGVSRVEGEIDRDPISAETRKQAEAALAEAAVVIFVVDVQCGVVAMDEEVAQLLRARSATVFVAANKADSPEHDDLALEFERLGFPVFPVSALHRRGFGDLMDSVMASLPQEASQRTAKPLRVAIVGKPNVGKSSYINRLLNSDRVIVSDVPGTTRDSIEIPFVIGSGPTARHYALYDTAGMRRSGKVDTAVERFSLMRAETTIRGADVVVLVLDAITGATRQDKHIASLILKYRRGCVILVNKWDLQSQTQRQFEPALLAELQFMEYCPIVYASAKSGYNVRQSIEAIDHVGSRVHMELSTGALNRAILDAQTRVSAQAQGGKRLKVFYSTQVGTHPIRIRIFVNDPDRAALNYRRYLEKAIRQAFSLEGAPVVLEFQARTRVTPESPRPHGARKKVIE